MAGFVLTCPECGDLASSGVYADLTDRRDRHEHDDAEIIQHKEW